MADGSNFEVLLLFYIGSKVTHACAPKDNISLSHGTEEKPTIFVQTGEINFNANELSEDLKSACEEVIIMTFVQPNKMNEAKYTITVH